MERIKISRRIYETPNLKLVSLPIREELTLGARSYNLRNYNIKTVQQEPSFVSNLNEDSAI